MSIACSLPHVCPPQPRDYLTASPPPSRLLHYAAQEKPNFLIPQKRRMSGKDPPSSTHFYLPFRGNDLVQPPGTEYGVEYCWRGGRGIMRLAYKNVRSSARRGLFKNPSVSNLPTWGACVRCPKRKVFSFFENLHGTECSPRGRF